jgi:hypothetical protein
MHERFYLRNSRKRGLDPGKGIVCRARLGIDRDAS